MSASINITTKLKFQTNLPYKGNKFLKIYKIRLVIDLLTKKQQ